jgi:Mn-dependent DtxR family transcriptional regulator
MEVSKIIEALKLSYGEKIAKWCQTPRTTSELREMYEKEESKSGVVVVGGLSFSDYLKRLEEAEVIEYKSGKWQTTPQGLEVLAKYFG